MDNYYVNLNYRELLVVSGEDSERFLQGQLSCDLNELSEYDSCLGCLCDNKGRVVASFTLWKLANAFYLEMESGLAAIAEQHLKKYSVFYKSEITIQNDAYNRIGLIGTEASQYLKELFHKLPTLENQVEMSDGNFLRMTDPENKRYEFWHSKNSTSPKPFTTDSEYEEGTLENWKILDLQAGLYRLQAEDSGLYTPQELNYDQLGHISFTKGCYTGQEIVARMHYRGKAKKRLHLLHIISSSSPAKNMKIVTDENKVVGEIIDVASNTPNQFQVQAIANVSIDQNISIENIKDSKIKLISS